MCDVPAAPIACMQIGKLRVAGELVLGTEANVEDLPRNGMDRLGLAVARLLVPAGRVGLRR